MGGQKIGGENSHNIQYLSQGGSHNIRYLVYYVYVYGESGMFCMSMDNMDICRVKG